MHEIIAGTEGRGGGRGRRRRYQARILLLIIMALQMSVSEGNLDVSKNEEGKADVGKKAGRGKFSPIGDRLISIPLLLACNCNCNL